MKVSLKFIITAMIALSLSLFATSIVAQTSTTGTIEGQVVDVNGAAVPGVTVTVTSSNLISPRSATSDAEGRYRILSLPPGRYNVIVEAASGFGRFEQQEVEVNISRSSALEIKLQPAGATASVTVTDTSGATVDVTTTTRGTNVSTEQFSNFPTSRTVQGLYTIAPTVVRSGLRDASGRERDPSVSGSSGPENNYILDGINTTDPAFGGSGANLPFEFVQEVEVKTGAYGAEYGRATGGIFNVITKSGSNEFHGDLFGYFTSKSFVRETKNLPFTGSAPNGFSEADLGGDIGGPIMKDKLWFFGAFNPQRRTNNYLTQTFHQNVENKVSTPFYAGKLTWAVNQNNTLTLSTFGDFTKVEGFLATAALTNVSGFGDNVDAFLGRQETGGHNYAFRLNSTFSQKFIGEFSGGLHFQRANTIPLQTGLDAPLQNDTFAVLRGGAVLPVTTTNIDSTRAGTGFVDFVDGRGGTLQRNFLRGPGFGLYSTQDRNRYELAARFQSIYGPHTFKYGAEWFRNIYDITQLSSGPTRTYANPNNLPMQVANNNTVNGYRVASNSFSVCTVRTTQIVCPSAAAATVAAALVAGGGAPAGITSAVNATITEAEALNNPFLVRLSTRVRDFELVANTFTNVESFYIQDDYKLTQNIQINMGLRWDYQQAYGEGGITYLKLNDFISNTQPRLGVVWDFTGKGKGKLFFNFARYLETPIPLDLNVRAGGGDSQTDKNFNVNRYNAPPNAIIVPGISANFAAVNLGADATPIDQGLKPQTVNEFSAGVEFEAAKDLALSFRGVYRAQDEVIEDGSFDDGEHYFLFNPGRYAANTTELLACNGVPDLDHPGSFLVAPQCFGPARRYYRAFEVSATKRFTNNYQFIASYVFSSLIGNYEGLFRNDNGQSDPNITSLFDLTSLLANTYGRLPNDRPHVFKFNGSYRTPFKLTVSGNFYAQSGLPFNQLIPHPVYGNNEGFAVPRGTAIIPNTGATVTGGSAGVESAVGSTRAPMTMNLDLGAYYPIVFSENKQLRFQVDWFNVFNSQRALTLDQTFTINSGVTGVPPVRNPFYGSGLIFQFPSSLRLGVKFQF
ncbi:MAG TPA: TonB-dependent receptor [Pyrinomonadaceae bacterium]|jgi:outer membrane receptor protein involved in Fe transport